MTFSLYLNFPVTLQGSYHYPHFVGGKTEPHRGEATCLRSHTSQLKRAGEHVNAGLIP